MSVLHISRLITLFKSQISQFINEDDIKKQKPSISADDIENIQLTQSYLLFALRNLTGLEYKELKKSIVDNFKDNGIDAILYSKQTNTLYLCQSKFSKKGKGGGTGKGDILKFVEGINDLINLKFHNFNKQVNDRRYEIEEAIFSANIRIEVILAHSGNNLSDEIRNLIQDKIEELNDTSEVIFFEDYNLTKAYNDLKEAVTGEPINVDLDLQNWGVTEDPYKSFYGTISCGKIAELAESNSKRLFSKNLRSYIGLNNINYEIVRSILNKPEEFFYLNNGIVLLCKEIKKSAYASGKRELGKFMLKDVSVINGAQTVGAIRHAFSKQPDKVNYATVFIKIISLENAPKEFDKLITVASNTQNRIEKRDFISLDDQQNKLVNDFFLCNLTYHVKRDSQDEYKNESNFYFEEATISLACFQESEDYSTYAKREIGKLWEDDNYKKLFSKSVNVQILVNLISAFRIIDEFIRSISEQDKRHICSHGIYLISNIIFDNHRADLATSNLNFKQFKEEKLQQDIERVCESVFKVYGSRYTQNKIPLSVFKNFVYCREIKANVLVLEGKIRIPSQQQTLF